MACAVVDVLTLHLPGEPVPDTTAPFCAVPRCTRRAADGLLCRHGHVDKHDDDGGHFAQLGRWLHDIQAEAERLDCDDDDPDSWAALPSLAMRLGEGGGGTLASQQSPAVLDAVAFTDSRTTIQGHLHIGPVCARCANLVDRRCTCPPLNRRREIHWTECPQRGTHPSCLHILADRDERGAERLVSILAVLHELAQRVRDGRMLGLLVRSIVVRVPPGYEGVYAVEPDGTVGATTLVPAAPTIEGEREVLTRHLDWIATQPWVLAMRDQVADLRAGLMRANRNEDDRPLTGYCYRHIDDQGTECRGNLWPVYTAHTAGPDAEDDDHGPLQPREVVCDRNPAHRWKGGKGGDLARLSMYLEQQRGVTRAKDERPAGRQSAGAAAGRSRALHHPGARDRLVAVLEKQRQDDAS